MPGMKPVVGMNGMGNASELAEMLRQMGRGRDTVLAHITPEEAQMLMDMGGSGSTNPDTGLPEFQPEFDLGESYGNVNEQPVDYSYMAPESVAMEANYPVDMTGFRQPTGFEQAMAPQPMPGGMQFETAIPSATERFDITAPAYRQPFPMTERQFLPETPQQPGLLTRGAQAVEGAAATARELAGKYPTVARLLSTGAQTLPALLNAARMRRQEMERASQLSQLGAPMRAEAQSQLAQARAGRLTPQQAQQEEANRARLRQAAATRGATTGTQAAMIENQLARARSGMVETNLNNALRQLNLANAYEEEAIKRKVLADREVSDVIGAILANIGQQQGAVRPQGQGGGQPTAPTPRQQPELGTATRRPELKQGT